LAAAGSAVAAGRERVSAHVKRDAPGPWTHLQPPARPSNVWAWACVLALSRMRAEVVRGRPPGRHPASLPRSPLHSSFHAPAHLAGFDHLRGSSRVLRAPCDLAKRLFAPRDQQSEDMRWPTRLGTLPWLPWLLVCMTAPSPTGGRPMRAPPRPIAPLRGGVDLSDTG